MGNLTEYIKDKFGSILEFARFADIPISSVNSVIYGKTSEASETARKMESVLGLPLDTFSGVQQDVYDLSLVEGSGCEQVDGLVLTGEMMSEVMRVADEHLTTREANVMIQHYYLGMTLRETGERNGVTAERMRHIVGRATRKIRENINAEMVFS